MKNKMENKIYAFVTAIVNSYKEYYEREDFAKLELKEEDLTEDFTAMLIALKVFYTDATGDDIDLIGFTHILNRLAIQYVMEEK